MSYCYRLYNYSIINELLQYHHDYKLEQICVYTIFSLNIRFTFYMHASEFFSMISSTKLSNQISWEKSNIEIKKKPVLKKRYQGWKSIKWKLENLYEASSSYQILP